jgi:hypothetical protein
MLRAGQPLGFRWGGTFPPERRAFESPIATACLREVTLRPDRDRSVPRFRSRMAWPTSRRDLAP